jgi:hypothetical protein
MRNSLRFVIAIAATLVVGAWAIPATADVDVYATLYKDKDVTVQINVTIDKDITITVDQPAVLTGAAEADVNINQRNELNVVDDAVDGTSEDFQLELDALIGGDGLTGGSVNDNTGVIGVNQDVGNMVNQANNVAFAITDSVTSLTHAEAFADQINQLNYSRQEEVLDPGTDCTPATCDPDKTATIEQSVDSNDGVVGVNQNAGNNNNQANGVAMAVGEGSHVALAESALGQVNTLNTNIAVETVHADLITESVNGNSGVVGVNQTVGNNNNQGAVTSFSVLTSTVAIEIPGSGI